MNFDVTRNNQNEVGQKSSFKHLLDEAHEKHIEKILKIYEDSFKTIQNLKEASINAVS